MKEKKSLKKDSILDIFPSCIFIIVLSVLIAPAMGIYCFKGESLIPNKNDVVDCSRVGLQREELYCRNVSEFRMENGQRKLVKVNRTCVASTWYATGFGLEFRCEEPHNKKDIWGQEFPQIEEQQCTCKENFCNSPPDFDVESVLDLNSASSIVNFLKFENVVVWSFLIILYIS